MFSSMDESTVENAERLLILSLFDEAEKAWEALASIQGPGQSTSSELSKRADAVFLQALFEQRRHAP